MRVLVFCADEESEDDKGNGDGGVGEAGLDEGVEHGFLLVGVFVEEGAEFSDFVARNFIVLDEVGDQRGEGARCEGGGEGLQFMAGVVLPGHGGCEKVNRV